MVCCLRWQTTQGETFGNGSASPKRRNKHQECYIKWAILALNNWADCWVTTRHNVRRTTRDLGNRRCPYRTNITPTSQSLQNPMPTGRIAVVGVSSNETLTRRISRAIRAPS